MGRDANEPELPPSAYMVMGMIREGFDTGYRIKQRLERVASLFWSVSYGQIYPELRRLEAAGMLASRDVSANGRLRREYSLTAAGEDELQRWLALPADPSLWLRDEGLLRLFLVDWENRDLARKNLLEFRRLTANRLEAIEARTPPGQRGQRFRELGVRVLQETLNWCDETDAKLRRDQHFEKTSDQPAYLRGSGHGEL